MGSGRGYAVFLQYVADSAFGLGAADILQAGGQDNTHEWQKIAEWQSNAKAWTEKTGLRRDYAREFVGTASGRQVSGLGRDNKGVKNTDNKIVMFSSEKVREILERQKPVDKDVLNRVIKGAEKQGITIKMGKETDKYLEKYGKEAMVIASPDGNIIVFHTKVSASGLFEELVHIGQTKKLNGRIPTEIENAQLEIEAKKKLLKNQKQYGITDYEVEVINESILQYENKIKELKDE